MSFDPREFYLRAVDEIRRVVGEERAIAACSGGVDSTVSAIIAKRAIGDKLIPVYIDDGFRRIGEPENVIKLLRGIGLDVRFIDARKEFLDALRGVRDAEEKRKIFRHVFYTVLGRVAREYGAKYLVQGTIAADVIETQRGIKTQHNVLKQIGLDPRTYGFEVIEPLKDLFKPQVRELAKYLGLPKEIWAKMPFPGPGLMIRVVGEVTEEKLQIAKIANKIVEEELSEQNYFQVFAAVLSDKVTGVKEGSRVYGYAVVVRAVLSEDAMTAKAAEIPYDKLKRIAERIIREAPGVARVLYDITDKPPATIEYE